MFNLKSHLLVSAAYNLGVLLNLEELIIPAGKGITSAAKLIVQQCLHLLHLRCFSFALHMDDDSLLEIGEFKGENLKHEITFLNREDTASEKSVCIQLQIVIFNVYNLFLFVLCMAKNISCSST